MRPHVSQESQPFDDTVVQVDEFCLGQLVDVDLHAHLIEGKARSRHRLTKPPNGAVSGARSAAAPLRSYASRRNV
jgi:hypothetical protein